MNIDLEEYLTEEKLLQKLQQGNARAFTAIYEKYSKPLFLKILRMVNDEEIAKEILQDLFMKIWETRLMIDTSRSFRSYLYVIGVNLVYDHFRKAAKNKLLASQILLMADEAYLHAEEEIISKENMELIRTAVDQLPPQRKKYLSCASLKVKVIMR